MCVNASVCKSVCVKKSPVCKIVCVCVDDLKRCKTSNLRFCVCNGFFGDFKQAGGHGSIHQSVANEATDVWKGHAVWSTARTCYQFHLHVIFGDGQRLTQGPPRRFSTNFDAFQPIWCHFFACTAFAICTFSALVLQRHWLAGHFINPLLSGLMEVFLHVRCIPHQNSQWQFWASVCVCVRVCVCVCVNPLNRCKTCTLEVLHNALRLAYFDLSLIFFMAPFFTSDVFDRFMALRLASFDLSSFLYCFNFCKLAHAGGHWTSFHPLPNEDGGLRLWYRDWSSRRTCRTLHVRMAWHGGQAKNPSTDFCRMLFDLISHCARLRQSDFILEPFIGYGNCTGYAMVFTLRISQISGTSWILEREGTATDFTGQQFQCSNVRYLQWWLILSSMFSSFLPGVIQVWFARPTRSTSQFAQTALSKRVYDKRFGCKSVWL